MPQNIRKPTLEERKNNYLLVKAYKNTPRGKALNDEAQKRYRKSPKGKAGYVRKAVTFRHKLRKEVLSHYGGKCACCGEKDMRFLNLDHIKGEGGKHRLEVLGHRTSDIYHWCRRTGYPKIFQVLCWSCNCGRAHNKGICPHKDRYQTKEFLANGIV